MIIYWKNHIRAFSGAHHYYAEGIRQGVQISGASGAPTVTLIAQSKANARFIQARVFGRVN